MDAKYDDARIELADGFLNALKAVMREEVAMMRIATPANADCWYWGRCTIEDISRSNGMIFEYGGAEDMPQDGGEQFAVFAD